MSYFGTALKTLLEKQNMKAIRLAELSQVGRATISRFISGDQDFVSRRDLEAICKVISEDPRDRAELIMARLLDERRGPGSELVRVEIEGDGIPGKPAVNYKIIPVPPSVEADIEIVREWCAKDPNVQELLEGLANLLRSGDCRTAAEMSGQTPKPVIRAPGKYPPHRPTNPVLNEAKTNPDSKTDTVRKAESLLVKGAKKKVHGGHQTT